MSLTYEQREAIEWAAGNANSHAKTVGAGETIMQQRQRVLSQMLAAQPTSPLVGASVGVESIEYAIQVLRQVEAGDGTFVGQCADAIEGLESLLVVPSASATVKGAESDQ